MSNRYPWVIRAGDTDFSGLVYTPAVVDHSIRSIESYRSDVGLSHQYFTERGLRLPMVNIEVDYHLPLRLDDIVTISLHPHVGNKSIEFTIEGTTSEAVAFEASMTSVLVRSESFEATTIPDEVRSKLAGSST